MTSHCLLMLTGTSLRVEGVAGVLRLDSRNSLSLHVLRVGADPRPVFPSQVTEELGVPVSGDVPLIKPGCFTGCRGRKFKSGQSAVETATDSELNNAGLTFQCRGKEVRLQTADCRKKMCQLNYLSKYMECIT